MFFFAYLTPNYPLVVFFFNDTATTEIYTVILNLIVTVVLTPVFNAMSAAQTGATVAADYHA